MIEIDRSTVSLQPDPSRVLAQPFWPGGMNFGGDTTRVDLIVERIANLTPEEVSEEVSRAEKLFSHRHRNVAAVWEQHAQLAREHSPVVKEFSPERLRLVGITFTQEYAFESTAVCNPSVVPTGEPDDNGTLEFVMSLRSIGEGHLSSISFRRGRLHSNGEVELDPPSPWAERGNRKPARFDSTIFRSRLREMRAENALSERVLESLPPEFHIDELEAALAQLALSDVSPALRFETERAMHWLAASSYEVEFDESVPLSERVLSPSGPTESRGMEDARMVRFVEDDGTVRYFATYTAYDGFEILPQLIETPDFRTFRVSTLAGTCARGKGMALFPRRIQGDYLALARTDHESTFVMRSDHVRRWEVAELALRPSEPWEVVQAGNCGSPIETDDGWLVLTHGVGPMRRYVISAVLLDLDEPTKVIGRLADPLLEPEEPERDGYVPNVVYSCGGLVHGDILMIPYGYADVGVRVATTSLHDVMSAMI